MNKRKASISPFKEGDIVQLKTGGPTMIVDGYHDDLTNDEKLVRCKWFAGKKLGTGLFHPATLEPVKEKPTKEN